MSNHPKNQPSDEPLAASPAKAGGDGGKATHGDRQDGLRETVESVVVAFILAFLFRAFEAEAFVIPTGSMAPTLYGRHKDVDCTQCGFHFAIGASDEVDNDYLKPGSRVRTAFCPNCRYENDVYYLPVFKGDRILVNKFPFEISDPARWDVTVFKYPEEPKTNYIKRLVGLPGETLLIERGDVYVEEEDGKRRILRKDDPNKQRVLQMTVYDNDHPETKLHEQGWPKRWSPVAPGEGPDAIAGWVETTDGWQPLEQTHSLQLAKDRTKDGNLRWIRYRHYLPAPEDWYLAAPPDDDAQLPPHPKVTFERPRPRLITDVCGYNDYLGGDRRDEAEAPYWVGDLTVSCQVAVNDIEDGAELLLELSEGVRRYRCRINLVTGEATISHNVELNIAENEEVVLAAAPTSMRGTGNYSVRFANVDDRLCLWVNGKLIDFGSAAEYELPQTADPDPKDEDLIPVGIAGRSAGLAISHILLERDIYYRGEDDNESRGFDRNSFRRALEERIHDPLAWGQKYRELAYLDQARFKVSEDEFFMLGDNSPRSKDSRLWYSTKTVPRRLLVGKAFYIYWPHGIPFLNGGRGYPDDEGQPVGKRSLLRHVPGFDKNPLFYHETLNGQNSVVSTDYPSIRIPFYPNVGRMRRIR